MANSKVKKTLNELSPEGYILITENRKVSKGRSKVQYHTKAIAENIKQLSGSVQGFERHEIAVENVLQTLKLYNGTKVLVVEETLGSDLAIYWLKKDGSKKFLNPNSISL